MNNHIYEIANKNHHDQLMNNCIFQTVINSFINLDRPPTDEEYISIIAKCCKTIEDDNNKMMNYILDRDNSQKYNW